MGFAPGACAQKIAPLKSSKAKSLGFDTLGKFVAHRTASLAIYWNFQTHPPEQINRRKPPTSGGLCRT
jgi:hypothetical protein